MPTFRGLPACSCLVAWLPVYEAELQRRGALDGPLAIFQLIGGAAASGGTHATGGAFDITDLDDDGVDVWVARQMGAPATWARTRTQGFVPHVHGVLRGCPHNRPAAYQIDAVEAGFNGLGSGGRGARDDGPRPIPTRDWRQGIAWAKEQGDDMPFTEEQLRAIIASELDKAEERIKYEAPSGDRVSKRKFFEGWRKVRPK